MARRQRRLTRKDFECGLYGYHEPDRGHRRRTSTQCADPAAGIGSVRAVVLHRRGMVRVRGRAERARLHIHTRVVRGDLVNLAWVAYCGEPG